MKEEKVAFEEVSFSLVEDLCIEWHKAVYFLRVIPAKSDINQKSCFGRHHQKRPNIVPWQCGVQVGAQCARRPLYIAGGGTLPIKSAITMKIVDKA